MNSIPTAHAFVEDVAATPLSMLSPIPGFGLVCSLHFVPFQCRMSVRFTLWAVVRYPTAHALEAEMADTLNKVRAPVSGSGLDWTAQTRPFQCSTSVCAFAWASRSPTAHAFDADVAATPYRKSASSGLGLGCTFHCVPFQCSTRPRSAGGLPTSYTPTAHALVGDVAATPFNDAESGFGTGWNFQADPFQRSISGLPGASPTSHARHVDTTATPYAMVSPLGRVGGCVVEG